MGLETFSNFIKDLNITNPAGSDNRSQGDDHIRGIKSTLKGQFSGIAGMATPTQVTADADELNLLDGVTATTVELNYVDGVTSNVQTQLDSLTTSLDAKAPLASPAMTGTPTAPTAAADTNTTQVATTAYVQTELGSIGGNAAGARTIEATTAGVPTGGSSGDITYQY